MKTIILAAGYSTRLYPLTLNFPKALLPIQGTEIIKYMLDDLIKTPGIDEITLVTNHRYFPLFQTWTKTYFPAIEVIDNGTTSKENRLGAIGDLQFVLDKKKWNDDILVLPSDTLFEFKLSEVLNIFKKYKGFTSVVRDCGDLEIIREKLGCAEIKDDQLISFEEKPKQPKSTYLSVPVYIYPKQTLPLIQEYIDAKQNLDSPGAIIPWLLTKTDCYVYDMGSGYSYDVGTVEMLNELNEKGVKQFPPEADQLLVEFGSFVDWFVGWIFVGSDVFTC